VGCEANRDETFIAGGKTSLLLVESKTLTFLPIGETTFYPPYIERAVSTKTPCVDPLPKAGSN